MFVKKTIEFENRNESAEQTIVRILWRVILVVTSIFFDYLTLHMFGYYNFQSTFTAIQINFFLLVYENMMTEQLEALLEAEKENQHYLEQRGPFIAECKNLMTETDKS